MDGFLLGSLLLVHTVWSFLCVQPTKTHRFNPQRLTHNPQRPAQGANTRFSHTQRKTAPHGFPCGKCTLLDWPDPWWENFVLVRNKLLTDWDTFSYSAYNTILWTLPWSHRYKNIGSRQLWERSKLSMRCIINGSSYSASTRKCSHVCQV